MSVPFAIAIYVVIWWTVLFAILPIGVRTQGEDGAIVPGTPESAPTRPRLVRVVLLTTLVSCAGVRGAVGGGPLRLHRSCKIWVGRRPHRCDEVPTNEKSKADGPCSRDCAISAADTARARLGGA